MKTTLLPAFLALFVGSNAPAAMPAVASLGPAWAPILAAPAPAPKEAAAQAPDETRATVPSLPAEMRVRVKKAKDGKLQLTVVHAAHLVFLAEGETQTLGHGSATLTTSGALPIRWETSDKASLQTIAGEITVDTAQSTKPQATLVPTQALKTTAETGQSRHTCKAFSRGPTTFSVLCRVDSLAVGAARTFADKPQAGITRTESGESTFFHVELDPAAEGVDALLLGYADGVRGHLVRAESVFVTGEQAPTLTLLSSSRAQPMPIPRFIHRHPPHFERFLGFD